MTHYIQRDWREIFEHKWSEKDEAGYMGYIRKEIAKREEKENEQACRDSAEA